jgi:hypothetical protein
MGTRGPAPKRDAERAGHRSADYSADHVELDEPVEIPPAKVSWHDNAIAWYEALAKSGQSRWYEPSDWAKAWLIADALSEYCTDVAVGPAFDDNGKPINGRFANAATLKVLFSEMASLGVTESDRRRMRIEIERRPTQTEDELADVIRGQFEALDGGA